MTVSEANGTNGVSGAQSPPVDVSIATSPNDVEAIPDLLKQIVAGVDALETGGDEARHDLLVKARTMVQALETPRETMVKHCWAQVRKWVPNHCTCPLVADVCRPVPWLASCSVSTLACGL